MGHEERELPEPQPKGARLIPPRTPPAPPRCAATGGDPEMLDLSQMVAVAFPKGSRPGRVWSAIRSLSPPHVTLEAYPVFRRSLIIPWVRSNLHRIVERICCQPPRRQPCHSACP
jgi:hypothetical protein